MQSFILRDGHSIPADAVFFAWTSADLGRMLAVRNERTHPVDRHALLSQIVAQTYKRRGEPEMRRVFLDTACTHVAEFTELAPAIRRDLGGILPRVPTFAYLATVLAEDRCFGEAEAVCRAAIGFGLSDGTKGDFAARITRIRKAEANSGRASV